MNSRQLTLPDGASALPAHAIGRQLANSDRLDLSESVSFFRRRLNIILALLGLCLLVGLGVSVFGEKTYRAQTTIMLIPQADTVATEAGLPQGATAMNGELVETQMEIIVSRDMAVAVANSLGLLANKSDEERRELIDRLQEHVSAERSGESYALTITVDALEPKMAATLANEYARQFTEWEPTAIRERHAQELEDVQVRLAELREQAQGDTQRLQQYRIANNLLTTTGASLTEQEIASYNMEVAQARAQAAEDDARLQTALGQLRSGSTGDDVGEALDSPVIASLRTQEAELAREVANLSTRYGPNHPQLVRTENELGELRGQIQAEIGRVISNLEAKSTVSAQRLGSLRSSLAAARGNLSQNNAAMVGLSELERSAEASQGIYEAYLNRYRALLAAEGTEKPHARILTFADVPLSPLTPNLKLNLALSIVIGLGLGVIAAYIAESLFQGITSAKDIEQGLHEHCLASIPLLQSVDASNSHAVTAIREDSKSAFAESFRALATSIGQATHGRAKVIAITSALPGEGKTIISCCLAHVLATSGKRTVLIDCDLRRRGISRLLDVKQEQQGLVEILQGDAQLDVEQFAGNRRLCIIPLKAIDGKEPEELLTSEAFDRLLSLLSEHFDHVIMDLPPVLPIASTPVIASRADAVVLAARWRKTSAFAIKAARKRLPDDLINVVGVALNQVDLRKKGYFDKNDATFYYDKYSEYYA